MHSTTTTRGNVVGWTGTPSRLEVAEVGKAFAAGALDKGRARTSMGDTLGHATQQTAVPVQFGVPGHRQYTHANCSVREKHV